MDHPFRTAVFGGFQREDVLNYLAEQARQSQQQREELERRLDEQKQETESAVRQAEVLSSQLEQQRAECGQLREEREALTGQLEQANRDLSASRTQCSQAGRELEELRKERDELQARLDAFLRTYLEFAWSHPAFYEVMALQKIPMQADYAGTPMEAAARQKYEAGMGVFLLTRKVLEGYLEEKGYTPPVSRDAAAFSVIVFLNGLLNTYYNKLAHTVFSDLEHLLDNCITLLKNSFRSG